MSGYPDASLRATINTVTKRRLPDASDAPFGAPAQTAIERRYALSVLRRVRLGISRTAGCERRCALVEKRAEIEVRHSARCAEVGTGLTDRETR